MVKTQKRKGPKEHENDPPSEAAYKRNKLIQVVGANPADDGAEKHHTEPEAVLLPLDTAVCLAAACEETVFQDPDRGEELQRDGQQDRAGVEELYLK